MDEDESWESAFAQTIAEPRPAIFRGIIKRKHIHACVREQRDFYYMDTGYFGNFQSAGNPGGRKLYHRIVKNELQKSIIEDRPKDRWESLIRSDPRLSWPGWKTKGNKILLILSNPKSCDYFGYNMQEWWDTTVATIKQHTDMPIVVRHKGSRSQRHSNSIYDVLDSGIFATVAFNSIAAMESIAYGVPAFVTVPCAATPLALTDLTKITTPYYPNESLVSAHCRSLAYGQFTAEEVVNGTAWKLLNQ
jgi:hypothetical protein